MKKLEMIKGLFDVGDYVVINHNAEKFLPSAVGKYGVISDVIYGTGSYDYKVKLNNKTTVKVKRDEVSLIEKEDPILQVNVNDSVKRPNGEIGEVVMIDYLNRQVEIMLFDGTFAVEQVENISKVEEVEDKKTNKLMDNHQLHKNILDEIHDTYLKKNTDYGNSFEEQYKEYGLLSAIIRFDDKIRRLKQLHKNEAKVKNESIRDTLMDLSNYAIMTVMELDKRE